MPNFKSLKFQLLLLNAVALALYIFVTQSLRMEVSSSVMFSSPDSITYLEVTDWFISGVDSLQVSRRPILYPLFLLFTYKIGGVYVLYLAQVVLWLSMINLSFLSVKKLTKNYIYAWVSAIILASNLSLIALTFHGLTEIPTAFLLSWLVYYAVKNKSKMHEPSFFQGSLLFLVALVILKPVFSLPLLGFLFVVFPIFYLKKYIQKPKMFLPLLVILFPVVLQLLIVKVKAGELKVSTIGSHTFEMYFITQGVERLENLPNDEAYAYAKDLGSEGQKTYLKKHGRAYFKNFRDNLVDNIKGIPNFLNYPKKCLKPSWVEFGEKLNKHSYTIHRLFGFLLLPFLLIFFFIRKDYENLLFVVALAALTLYYIVTTGISFYQGDRLVLPAIAIWAILYPFYGVLLNRNWKKGNCKNKVDETLISKDFFHVCLYSFAQLFCW
jgi:hypothetical protein